MKPNPLPPLEVLQALFTYCPDTGELRNRCSRGAAKAGELAGRMASGYLQVQVQGRLLMVNRIAYAIHHGRDPFPLEVDHINRCRFDNRACNLRAVTRSENLTNTNRKARQVCITYPDGRGSIIVSSILTASSILNVDRKKLSGLANNQNNQIFYPHPTLPNVRIPTGIYVSYV